MSNSPFTAPMRSISLRVHCLALALLSTGGTVHAQADDEAPRGHQGKLLLTGGVSSVDGAAGGGLTPWAVTGTYATEGQFSGSGALTYVRTRDFELKEASASVSVSDRLEISLAHQDFDAGPVGSALAGALMDPGFNGLHLKQDVLGLKARIVGDAVLDSDSLMPQIALGLELKQGHEGRLRPVLSSFGARDSGTDLYASATKLLLAQGILVNGTLRATKANQTGLLGFGATGHQRYSLEAEASLAWLVSRTFAVGLEYRAKPDNLRDNTALGSGALKESDWKDVFVAWAPTKAVSLTLAFVDLGSIVPGVASRRQTGGYASVQFVL